MAILNMPLLCFLRWHGAGPFHLFLLCVLLVDASSSFVVFFPSSKTHASNQRSIQFCNKLPNVWIEAAEDDFVDEEENLEEGEVCLKSVKAFASNPNDYYDYARFLAAGALVRRPNSMVCDVWTADALLDDGAPNLALQGANLILDELLLFHMKHNSHNGSILGLQTFVLHCGEIDSEYTCASYMAGQSRGFKPLAEQLRTSSIYSQHLYQGSEDGFVLDCGDGKKRYELISSVSDESVAKQIYEILPDEATIRRFTTKRYTID